MQPHTSEQNIVTRFVEDLERLLRQQSAHQVASGFTLAKREPRRTPARTKRRRRRG